MHTIYILFPILAFCLLVYALLLPMPPDSVEVSWNRRKSRMKSVRFEYEDGEVRELSNEQADEWWHDLHRLNCKRQVDWTRHKWTISKPDNEKQI